MSEQTATKGKTTVKPPRIIEELRKPPAATIAESAVIGAFMTSHYLHSYFYHTNDGPIDKAATILVLILCAAASGIAFYYRKRNNTREAQAAQAASLLRTEAAVQEQLSAT